MDSIISPWSRVFLAIAGILLFFESLLGCVYVLGIGFDSVPAICTDLAVTMGFPIYALSFYSLRVGAISLWALFAFQWLNLCLNSVPPGFVNPLGWIHGTFLFCAAILVSICAWNGAHNKFRHLALW